MSDERSSQMRGALAKGVGFVVVVAVAIALGTVLLVRMLGLDSSDSGTPVGGSAEATRSSLPTSALPQPGDDGGGSPTPEQPSGLASPSAGAGAGIQLSVTPVIARPMERVNFTGTYRGADNVTLQVQRFDDGTWSNFAAKTTVKVGTFATYIMTGRTGENRFRVFDPAAGKGSNVVLVTIQ